MFVKDEVVDEAIESIFIYTKWGIMDAEMILIDHYSEKASNYYISTMKSR
jgi:hypothetical protein